MKHLSLIITILLLAVTRPVHAQYYSVNYDARTVAAMAAAFGTEAVAEGYEGKRVKNFRRPTTAGEGAAPEIFGSNFLQQKAYTDREIG